ncbi:MAG: DUF1266 domain-containing protein [Lachnospiraceae bacterium]|nr:DUF1266 domain-containing protein [Lachnospiraceae bacterium]MDE6186053.1 DUF1266 domain-containing protein [Lachnospiraceae bacterium]
MKKSKKLLVILVLLMAIMLAGCGSGSNVELKEFMLDGDTVSICMDESWAIDDLDTGIDFGAFTSNGNEGIVVMQYEKALYGSNIADMSSLKSLTEESFGIQDPEKTDNPAIADLENVETYKCTLVSDGTKGSGMILYGETDYAYYSIIYIAPRISAKKTEYFKNVCETFKEIAPEVEAGASIETTDTILWFNATCAVLTDLNGWDCTIFGGQPASESVMALRQEGLDSSWDVTDRATADETMDWLLSEGHRASFVVDMQFFEESGIGDVAEEEWAKFIFDNFEVEEEEAQCYANGYGAYKQYGDDTIAAWDYSRAMWLYASYYLSGYYTKEEALDASLALAAQIQSSFDSWDSFMESYFIGYEYWAEELSDERRGVYEDLKSASDSPFNVDWNLAFEKTW